MNLKDYFEQATGLGVLSTVAGDGTVSSAVYARPHCFDDGTVGFIMPERLTYRNLTENGKASYLFHQTPENGERKYEGLRLHLTKVSEDDDQERIDGMRRRRYGDARDGRHLIIFAVDRQLPLVGPGDEGSQQ